MPGLISGLFEPQGSQQESQQTTTLDGGTETGIEASPSIGVGLSGSYEDADGTNHQWSNSTDVGADIDVDAALATSTQLTDAGTNDLA